MSVPVRDFVVDASVGGRRVIPKFMLQGGDFTDASGIGGESIYGAKFPVRATDPIKRTQRGMVRMFLIIIPNSPCPSPIT